MDAFPFDLILAVATAWATIFLGYLPITNIRSSFFARETRKAALAWGLITLVTPVAVMHFPFLFALICGGAWWKFRHDSAFGGKLWLWVASGLGIGMGVMLLLAITPRAYPGLPPLPHVLLLVSIYLGGALIGLAYISASLAHNLSTDSGVTYAVVQRYVALLLNLTLARAVVLVALLLLTPNLPGHIQFIGQKLPTTQGSFQFLGREVSYSSFGFGQEILVSNKTLCLLGMVVFLMPGVAYLASRATRFSSRIKPTRYLLAFSIFGIFAEVLARFLVL